MPAFAEDLYTEPVIRTRSRGKVPTGVWIDASSLYLTLMSKFDGRKLNYAKYIQVVEERKSDIVVMKVFGVQVAGNAKSFIDTLIRLGFQTDFINITNFRYNNRNIAMIADIFRYVYKDTVDRIVIGSNHARLKPFIDTLLEFDKEVIMFGSNLPPFKDVTLIEIEEDLLGD